MLYLNPALNLHKVRDKYYGHKSLRYLLIEKLVKFLITYLKVFKKDIIKF
jgi:hypothetical protein